MVVNKKEHKSLNHGSTDNTSYKDKVDIRSRVVVTSYWTYTEHFHLNVYRIKMKAIGFSLSLA